MVDSQTTVRIIRNQPQPQQQQQSADNYSRTGLDFCFLMDITGSMQKYVDGTLKALKELIKQLQAMYQSGSIKIGFLGYRDFEKENPGEKQFDFIDLAQYAYQTIEESKLYDKLNSIKCSGGGDFAEDIRGAILKAVSEMNWSGRMKYLVLIADAPAHGIMYNQGKSDNYPDEKPLDEALEKLIEKDIRLVILEVAQETNKMVKQLRLFYEKKQRQTYFETNELNASTIEDVAKKLSSCLADTIKRNLQACDTLKNKK